jgi:hypothetical protein
VDTLVSVEKISQDDFFSIYPNPSDGNITIQATQNMEYQVAVYDVQGKLIVQKSNATQIFIPQSGAYLVQIVSEKGVWSRKVVVE